MIAVGFYCLQPFAQLGAIGQPCQGIVGRKILQLRYRAIECDNFADFVGDGFSESHFVRVSRGSARDQDNDAELLAAKSQRAYEQTFAAQVAQGLD